MPMASKFKIFIQISKRSQPHSMSTDVQGSFVCQHVKPTVVTQWAAQTPHHTQNIRTLASHLVILKQQSLLSTILPRATQTLQFNSNGTACACISSDSSRLSLVPWPTLKYTLSEPTKQAHRRARPAITNHGDTLCKPPSALSKGQTLTNSRGKLTC